MARSKNVALWIAIILVVFYVGVAGAAKLIGVPYVHSSFPKLGLPGWFGYFIGTCEVLGSIGLLTRPMSAMAALGIGIIVVGATYYHAACTLFIQAAPAFVLTILCIYIFLKTRTDAFRFNEGWLCVGAVRDSLAAVRPRTARPPQRGRLNSQGP